MQPSALLASDAARELLRGAFVEHFAASREWESGNIAARE